MTEVAPDPSDIELLGLQLDEDGRSSRFELTPPLARHDGALYGGTGIAVSIAAMEAATRRPVLWVTTQFVATTYVGSVIEVATEVLAAGRAISQVQVTGRFEDRVLFVSIGSTATPREGGMEGQYEVMPVVSGVGDSSAMWFGPITEDPKRFRMNVEYRPTEVLSSSGGEAPHMAMWARVPGARRSTRATLSFLADMVPAAIGKAAGSMGGGPSLDNSMRFGAVPEDLEWVLLDMRGHLAHGSHAHGMVRVWSPGGQLLAIGGQSANMMFRGLPPGV